MKVYIFGNGNIKFDDFEKFYLKSIKEITSKNNVEFIVCDFRGVDTLTMEYLKSTSKNVTIVHIGEKPRYLPDRFKTKVNQWKIKGNFEDDKTRDNFAINTCTHFIAKDFNSDINRKSGTQRNIELCKSLGKIQIND